MSKYLICMSPADSDRIRDRRYYAFNDVNEFFRSLIDSENPINQAMRREAVLELTKVDARIRDYLLEDFEGWIEHEFTNVITDIQYYINQGIESGKITRWTYWNINHELEVIE